MCSHDQNPIVAAGVSRGGRWLEQIVREYSAYVDVAIIIAGYPETIGRLQNAHVAKELIAVKSTIVCMVHFAADSCCNAGKYPVWYMEFELASEKRCQKVNGITGFMNYMLPGVHDDGQKLFYNWNFAEFSSELGEWFETMWTNLVRAQPV